MDEKKSELKVATGGIVAVLAIALPVVYTGVQAVLEAGLVTSGTWAYVGLTVLAAATSTMIAYMAKAYGDQRAAVKVARFGTTETKLGASAGSIRTKLPGITGTEVQE